MTLQSNTDQIIVTDTDTFAVAETNRWRFAAEEQWRRNRQVARQLQEAQTRIEESKALIAEQERKIRELENLADTDPLTGLMNRRGFEKFFDRERERARRHTLESGVFILIDVDAFKGINDLYGHAAGDACLKKIADYLTSSLRMIDGVGRLGGDEFVAMLTHTTTQQCRDRLDDIRYGLAHMQIEWDGATIHFGASMGAENVMDSGAWIRNYRAADEKLYASKRLQQDNLATLELVPVV